MMDDVVLRAMAKWPDVPSVFGWLSLERRGRWLIRGESITNTLLVDFIGRNYGHDASGRWFFQNGPQRVFVCLAYTPWIVRVDSDGRLATHTGRAVHHIEGAWIDEEGSVLLATEHGAGMVDDRDVEALASRFTDRHGRALDDDTLLERIEAIQAGGEADLVLPFAGRHLALAPMRSAEVAGKLGFVADPEPSADAQACA